MNSHSKTQLTTVSQTIRASLGLLSGHDRRVVMGLIAAQMATSILDMLGVLLVGTLGALSVTMVAGEPLPQRLTALLSALGLDSLPPSTLIGILGCIAAGALFTKSVVSPLLMARVLRFLAGREAAVSVRLARELLARPLTFVQQRSSQETAAALVQCTTAATTTVLSQTTIIAAEIALLTVIAVALLAGNPVLALGVIAFLGIIGFGMHRVLGHRAADFGGRRASCDITTLRTIQESLHAYREMTVADRRSFYVERIDHLRTDSARISAQQQLIYILPKYLSEAALVLGALALAATLFTTQSLTVAVGTFALFLVAATRVMPSLLRLQSATLSIRAAAGSAARTFDLADALGSCVSTDPADQPRRASHVEGHPGFRPTVQLLDVTFTYPGSTVPAVSGVTLQVGVGSSMALVGHSGAGKSTLADVILGVLEPDTGTVSLGGLSPGEAVRRWPGAVAYVPQDISLANDSVRNNVALGLPPDCIEDELVWDALRRAHLAEYLHQQPQGLDTRIGERGLRLSGGQRQRLGLARALFTRPLLLVLDEATSSLDAETEQAITETLDELDEEVTTIIIAHRLSTVRHADIVVYLEGGRNIAIGSFDGVCARVPALQRQADLMGLRPT